MIGIIVAMSLEREAIQQLIEDHETVDYVGKVFHIGTISGKRIVMVEGGVGKVASAITCTIMLERFDCEMVINIGTCGGMKEYENVLDVIIADRMTYHDWDELSVNEREPSFETNQYSFVSTPALIELARDTISDFDKVHATYVGSIVSGDAFIRFDEQVEKIKKYYPEAIGCDMESTSIAQVCTQYGIDFVIIRSLSDIVIKEGNEIDFHTYAERASERAVQFTSAFLKRL